MAIEHRSVTGPGTRRVCAVCGGAWPCLGAHAQIAILRKCRQCERLRSIECFEGIDKVCRDCADGAR